MATVLIVGDGPGGLSAALFLAKKGQTVHVFGSDETPMHKARLLNYLGIDDITGSEFQQRTRAQVEKMGANLHRTNVQSAKRDGDGFRVDTADGQSFRGEYVILAAGSKSPFAAMLGLDCDDRGFVITDREASTNVERAYAVGWSARPDKVQAIISAGDGAAAALDILSREAGKPVHDFDVP